MKKLFKYIKKEWRNFCDPLHNKYPPFEDASTELEIKSSKSKPFMSAHEVTGLMYHIGQMKSKKSQDDALKLFQEMSTKHNAKR